MLPAVDAGSRSKSAGDVDVRPVLPQELCDQIIENLHGDRDALKACSLTCWRWVDRSRSQLHCTVSLEHRYYRSVPSSIVRCFSRLVNLPDITRHIRVLHLKESCAANVRQSIESDDDADEDGHIFWPIISQLAHIDTLHIDEDPFLPHFLEDRIRLYQAFPSLKRLDLQLGGLDGILDSLSSFPELRALRIITSTGPSGLFHDLNTLHANPPNVIPGMQLRYLQLSNIDADSYADIAEWLKSLSSGTMRTLRFEQCDDIWGYLPSICQGVGASIEHLSLGFSIKSPSADDQDSLAVIKKGSASLEVCKNLRSFSLLAGIWGCAPTLSTSTMMWSIIRDILANLTANHLRHIRFICLSGHVFSHSLACLDDILSRPPFDHLEHLSFQCYDFPSDAGAEEIAIIRAALPSLGSSTTIDMGWHKLDITAFD